VQTAQRDRFQTHKELLVTSNHVLVTTKSGTSSVNVRHVLKGRFQIFRIQLVLLKQL